MRRDDIDAVLDDQSRRLRVDHIGGKPLRARRFAGAGEDHIMIGDPAIGDPGLHAVDPYVIRPVRRRRRAHGGDIGPGLRFGEREGRDGFAAGHRRQISGLQRLGAEQRDRSRAESLHRKGEIGQPVVKRERLPRQTERTDIEGWEQPAIASGTTALSQPASPRAPHEAAAGGVDVVVIDERFDVARRPDTQVASELPVAVFEERPGEKARVDHVNLP